ncbi:MAG: hypothetical protein WAS07_14760 [Micropruina sp.]
MNTPLTTEHCYYQNMTETWRAADRPLNEREVLRATIAELRQRMPPMWALEEGSEVLVDRARADAVLRLRSPDGDEAVFIVEAKTVIEARDVPNIRNQLETWIQSTPGSVGMVVARYLAKPVRDRLTAAGLSYADTTGNVLFRASRPGLYVADRGADRDPWRGPGRPRGTLKGEPAAKVVRALLDRAQPWRVTDLVDYSRASTGSVYRVVEYLKSEELAVRDPEGRVTVPDWVALLRRWSEDYQFARTNAISRWIAPRGLDYLLSRIREGAESDYAVTGTLAAARYAAYAPARSAMIYVGDAQRAAKAWDLRSADSGVNVLLAEPAFPTLLERLDIESTGIKIVKPAQIAVDLMTGPGRSPAEAEELVKWMRSHEQSWR